jgi:hypothetical protein
LSIHLIEIDAWWKAIGVQELRKTIKQRVIHYRYPKMHLGTHISESIRRMGSGDNFITDTSERLPIANVKEAYRSTTKGDFIRQMLKHNNWCTCFHYMEVMLCHLALQGWYDIDSAKLLNLLSSTDKL